MIEEKENEKKS